MSLLLPLNVFSYVWLMLVDSFFFFLHRWTFHLNHLRIYGCGIYELVLYFPSLSLFGYFRFGFFIRQMFWLVAPYNNHRNRWNATYDQKKNEVRRKWTKENIVVFWLYPRNFFFDENHMDRANKIYINELINVAYEQHTHKEEKQEKF